jgi:hypothetical protein
MEESWFDLGQGHGRFLFFKISRKALGLTQPTIRWVMMGAVSPRGKVAMGAADQTPPSTVEFKNEWM